MYNDDVTLDDEGADLADPQAAFAHAVKAARSLAAESVVHGHLVRTHRIEIRDAERNSVGTVRFEEASTFGRRRRIGHWREDSVGLPPCRQPARPSL